MAETEECTCGTRKIIFDIEIRVPGPECPVHDDHRSGLFGARSVFSGDRRG